MISDGAQASYIGGIGLFDPIDEIWHNSRRKMVATGLEQRMDTIGESQVAASSSRANRPVYWTLGERERAAASTPATLSTASPSTTVPRTIVATAEDSGKYTEAVATATTAQSSTATSSGKIYFYFYT